MTPRNRNRTPLYAIKHGNLLTARTLQPVSISVCLIGLSLASLQEHLHGIAAATQGAWGMTELFFALRAVPCAEQRKLTRELDKAAPVVAATNLPPAGNLAAAAAHSKQWTQQPVGMGGPRPTLQPLHLSAAGNLAAVAPAAECDDSAIIEALLALQLIPEVEAQRGVGENRLRVITAAAQHLATRASNKKREEEAVHPNRSKWLVKTTPRSTHN